MAAKKAMRVRLLVEDRQHERLAREVLEELGYSFRVVPYTRGQGAGEQRVRESYSDAVTYYRRRANHLNVGLLVCIDADSHTVQERSKHLADRLAESNMKPREEKERIVHWIPKWNVETWILHLTGNEVDEKQSYKDRLTGKVDFKGAAAEFELQFGKFKQGVAPELPALETAFQETRRLQD